MIRVRAGRARLLVMETSSPQIPSPKITATMTRPTHFPESAGAAETFRTSFMALLPQAIVTYPWRALAKQNLKPQRAQRMAAEDAEKGQHLKSQGVFVAYRENPHPNLAKNTRLGWGTQSFFPSLSS